MVKKNTQIIMGIFLVVAGAISLGNHFGWWSIAISFSGWWTLLIIIPFFSDVLSRGIKLWNTLGLAIGIWFLIVELHILSYSAVLGMSLPIAILMLGVVFIINH